MCRSPPPPIQLLCLCFCALHLVAQFAGDILLDGALPTAAASSIRSPGLASERSQGCPGSNPMGHISAPNRQMYGLLTTLLRAALAPALVTRMFRTNRSQERFQTGASSLFQHHGQYPQSVKRKATTLRNLGIICLSPQDRFEERQRESATK